MREISEKVIKWISSRVKEAKAEGVVFGMSGGLDSSVVGVLAKKALASKALGLIMPCDSKASDRKHALLVAKKFGINHEIIDLTPIYRNLLKIFPKADQKTKGNLKARLRMLTLYYFANRNRYLVLGTGNKSELLQNYFTKYGDGGVDLLPLGDLYKTQVIRLAKYLGIPGVILNKEPSAGLWKYQTDEKELGIGYKKLDMILYRLFDKKLKPKEAAEELEIPLNKVKEIVNRYQRGKHKLSPPSVAKV
jgi:NAD+ synthase